MAVITSIKPQKNGKRVNIYLDGKFGFGLDLENYLKLGLKVEQELLEDKIEEIVKKAEFQKVYDKILRFAGVRPRSKKEFETWLKKYRVYGNFHSDLFNRLKRLDFLNDEKFATWWIDQRHEFRPKSQRVLIQELKIKGIDKQVISKALQEAKIDETTEAGKIISKKKYLWDKLEGFEKKVKMSQFLARRGFDWETIRKVLKKFDQEY